MKADDILRFERIMDKLLASRDNGVPIEAVFQRAATLASLRDHVWVAAPSILPRRLDGPGED